MVLVPDATVTIQDAPPTPATLNDTGTGFMIGLADRGPVTGQLKPEEAIHSLSEWIAKHGSLQSYNGNEYVSVEGFFADGGSRLFYSRYAGPSAVKASAAVPASSSKFTATAKGPGAGYNTIKVGVASSVVTVKDGTTIVEVSPAMATIADAQSWATNYSKYIDITPLTTGALADSADVPLASGADDRTNVTDTERQAAVNRFGRDLGPGQIGAPGDTRTAMHTILATHALTYERAAVGDCPDSATAATAAAPGPVARALGRDLARHIRLLGDWVSVPGTSAGTTRMAPPSGIYMGLCARNDAERNPAHAVAGQRSYSRFALGTHYQRSQTDLQTFADNGIIPFVVDGGLVQPMDDITPVDSTIDEEWWAASGNRMVMRIVWDARAIAKAYMWTPVAGNVDFVGYAGALSGMLSRWHVAGALFGDSPAEAFRVETGPAINTPTTIAAKKLRAQLSLHLSQNVRNSDVLLTNTPLTEAL
jgi:hypothetical protein